MFPKHNFNVKHQISKFTLNLYFHNIIPVWKKKIILNSCFQNSFIVNFRILQYVQNLLKCTYPRFVSSYAQYLKTRAYLLRSLPFLSLHHYLHHYHFCHVSILRSSLKKQIRCLTLKSCFGKTSSVQNFQNLNFTWKIQFKGECVTVK